MPAMADSELTISSLTATGAAGQIVLDFVVDNPTANGLPYLFLDHVDIYAASSNNRDSATKVGSSVSRQFIHSGLSKSTTRYYWVKAVNASGYDGEWYPSGATSGVSAETTNEIPDVDQLSDINDDLGEITAGTVTGAPIRTGSGDDRVQINSEINALEVYNNGLRVGEIGGDGNFYVLNISAGTNGPAMFASANVGSPAAAEFVNFGNSPTVKITGKRSGGAALEVENNGGTSGGRYAVKAENSGSGGGTAWLGADNANGGVSLYAPDGVSPFTGMHEAVIAPDDEAEIGDIVVDYRLVARSGISNTLFEVKRSSSLNQKGAVGVLSRRSALEDGAMIGGLPEDSEVRPSLAGFDRATINALGEGQMNVCGRGGNIEAGDFIVCSDMAGKGQRMDMAQPMTFDLMSTIVCRAREAVTFDSADQVKMVAIIYMAG
jgi:hypothetical protein